MNRIILKSDVIVGGSPGKKGDILEVNDTDYRILKSYGFVEDCHEPIPEEIKTKPTVGKTNKGGKSK